MQKWPIRKSSAICYRPFLTFHENCQNPPISRKNPRLPISKSAIWKLPKTDDFEITAIFRSEYIGYFRLNACEYPSLRLGLSGSPNLYHLICGIGTPPETLQSRVTDPERITSWSVLSFPFGRFQLLTNQKPRIHLANEIFWKRALSVVKTRWVIDRN